MFILICCAFALSKVTGWVTLNGVHVLIDKIGNIVGGPANLIGTTYKDAVSKPELVSGKVVGESDTTGWQKINGVYGKVNKNGYVYEGPPSLTGSRVAPKIGTVAPKVPFPTTKQTVPEHIVNDPYVKTRAARYPVNGEIRYYKEYLKTPQQPVPKNAPVGYTKVVESTNSRAVAKVIARQLITRKEADAFKEGVYHGTKVKTK